MTRRPCLLGFPLKTNNVYTNHFLRISTHKKITKAGSLCISLSCHLWRWRWAQALLHLPTSQLATCSERASDSPGRTTKSQESRLRSKGRLVSKKKMKGLQPHDWSFFSPQIQFSGDHVQLSSSSKPHWQITRFAPESWTPICSKPSRTTGLSVRICWTEHAVTEEIQNVIQSNQVIPVQHNGYLQEEFKIIQVNLKPTQRITMNISMIGYRNDLEPTSRSDGLENAQLATW